MNFLAHAYLAGDDPQAVLGGVMGDFVKGPLDGRYPEGVRAGLALHRRIDTYTDAHPGVRAARRLVSPPRRRYAGILLDMFFDHFLAARWAEWSELPLTAFSQRVYGLLEENRGLLPPRLATLLPAMARHDWLASYREPAALAQALERMGRRLSRGNALAGGERELLVNYGELRDCFDRFFPDLVGFAAALRRQQEGGEAAAASPPSLPHQGCERISGRDGVGG